MAWSCDTAVAVGDAAADGGVVFLKNTDRDRNEAAVVEYVRGGVHAAGTMVATTRAVVPQALRTHGVLLVRPAWSWGAEMGGNDVGVVGGNEAVFAADDPPHDGEGLLTGMDLLRLALERGSSASEAAGVITTLLEAHGQGGDCGWRAPFYYHNAWLLADSAGTAVHVESVGRLWVRRTVTAGVTAISNALSITDDYDAACDTIVAANAARAAEYPPRGRLDWAASYADVLKSTAGCGGARAAALAGRLRAAASHGGVDVAAAAAALRDHTVRRGIGVAEGWTGLDVCMHAGGGPIRTSQTTGSFIATLPPPGGGAPTFYVTGTAAPCLSLFKPIVLPPATDGDGGWLGRALGRPPEATYAVDGGRSRWWRHELMHRALMAAALRDPPAYHAWCDAAAALQARVEPTLQRAATTRDGAVLEAAWRAADATADALLAAVLQRRTPCIDTLLAAADSYFRPLLPRLPPAVVAPAAAAAVPAGDDVVACAATPAASTTPSWTATVVRTLLAVLAAAPGSGAGYAASWDTANADAGIPSSLPGWCAGGGGEP